MVPVSDPSDRSDNRPSPPTLCFIPPSSLVTSTRAALVPPPPVQPSTTMPELTPRPAKRYVRPRATTDDEKKQRLEERKIANRTAAKHSRDRQKQAMEQALQENERLKEENSQLLSRLTNLEQRMAELESKRQKPQELQQVGATHQPARPMSPEQQCPIPHSSSSDRCLTSRQMRVAMYLLQTLMHSFALSMVFRNRLNLFLLVNSWSSRLHRRPALVHKTPHSSSHWMRALRGYATPNPHDLGGAIRSALVRRGRVKVVAEPCTAGRKNWLRTVRRDTRRGKQACIRLIIRKKPMKRMHKYE